MEGSEEKSFIVEIKRISSINWSVSDNGIACKYALLYAILFSSAIRGSHVIV